MSIVSSFPGAKTNLIAVPLPALLINDTHVDEGLIVPVIALRPLTGDTHVSQKPSCPIRIALRVSVIRIQPRIQVLRAVDKLVIRTRLNRPLSHKHRKLPITS